MMKKYLWPASLLVLALGALTGGAGAQPKLAPLPIYEQCASLSDGPNETLKRDLAALKNPDAAARAEAVKRLSKACHQQSVEPLLDLLRNEDGNTRLAAIETLGRLGAKDTIDPLRELTGDPDWRVRLALVPALASFKVFQAKNAVLNSIASPVGVEVSDEDDMRVRCIAILTLNELTDVTFSRKAVDFVSLLLRSNRLNIRQMAEQTMYALKATRNGPRELIGLLKQHNMPEKRRWVCEWLGKLELEIARPALEEAAANDAHPAVKYAAAEALRKLNGAVK